MGFNGVTKEIINQLIEVVGQEFVLFDQPSFEKYGQDETENLIFHPEVVIVPELTQEVSEIVKICNEHNIPLTPRGAGTGLSGGALPVEKGILLSMERFNAILDIDEKNLQATVEPGVITQVFQEELKKKGLCYPPDPASRGSCYIGGNLAENSGGPKAVKYGVTKDYVLNLEVVLPTGEVIWTGANVLKNATGYNITQLMVGSEGTLGIITKAVFRLIPYPRYDLLMLVPFYSAEDACRAVSNIFQEGITPSGLEFMERDALDLAMDYIQEKSFEMLEKVEAHLLIEVDGNDEDLLFKECETVHKVLSNYNCGEILFAQDSIQKERLWKARRIIGEAVKSSSIYKEEDTVVPRAELPKLLKGVKEIGQRYGFKSICYGHAGDGNLHINILKKGMTEQEWNEKLTDGIKEIFKLCVELGGTISGEHGIGYVQKEFMNIAFNKVELSIQKKIKEALDPAGILNPSKIFI